MGLKTLDHQVNSSSSKDENIKVSLRVRCLLPFEQRRGGEDAWMIEQNDGFSTITSSKSLSSQTRGNSCHYFNNIFNTEYWESNLVPMPKGNGLFGLRYSF